MDGSSCAAGPSDSLLLPFPCLLWFFLGWETGPRPAPGSLWTLLCPTVEAAQVCVDDLDHILAVSFCLGLPGDWKSST